MTTTNHPKPAGREWLRRQADAEERCTSVSVGGLASDLGMFKPVPETEAVTRAAFARLVQLARRSRGMSPEMLAQTADIELAEVVSIEQCEEQSPEPRTVFKLAQVLKLPETPLMELAGLVHRHSAKLDTAAVRFAARSESMERLSREEEAAFREFVQTLAELSRGE